MKLIVLFLVARAAFAAEWDAVQRIAAGHKIEVTDRSGNRTRAAFVSASGDAVVVREKTSERSIARAEIRHIRVADPGRRIRRGILWTAIAVGAGVGVGFAACPSCSNEGHGDKYVGPGAAIGAGIGALGFLSAPYSTIYKTK